MAEEDGGDKILLFELISIPWFIDEDIKLTFFPVNVQAETVYHNLFKSLRSKIRLYNLTFKQYLIKKSVTDRKNEIDIPISGVIVVATLIEEEFGWTTAVRFEMVVASFLR